MNRRLPNLFEQMADELHELTRPLRIFYIESRLWTMRTRTRIELFYYNLRNGLGDVSETDSAFLIAAVMITLMLWFAFLLR